MTRANPASIDPPGASDASSLRRARVTVRQLCSLRLPAPVLLPSLLPAVRAVVRSSHAAFFYADAAGNMTNMYAERMLPPEAMARYYEQYYRADSSAFTKSYLSLVAASDPVSYRTVGPVERSSDYFRDVLSPLDVGHIMYGIVRAQANGREPIGQLSLYRPETDIPFSPADAEALRDVLHYLGRALSAAPFAPVSASAEQTAEEAMAVLDESGTTLFADEGWLRLVRLARGEPISPVQAAAEPKRCGSFCTAWSRRLRPPGTRCTPWTLRGDDSRFAITGSKACLGSGRLRWFSRAWQRNPCGLPKEQHVCSCRPSNAKWL